MVRCQTRRRPQKGINGQMQLAHESRPTGREATSGGGFVTVNARIRFRRLLVALVIAALVARILV